MQEPLARDWSSQRQQELPANPLLVLRASIGAELVIAASILFAIAIGALFVLRRATGSLTAPLPAPQLVLTAAGLCVWAWLVHVFVQKRWVVGGILIAVLLVAVGCSYPGGRMLDWVVWLPVIGLVSWFPAMLGNLSRIVKPSLTPPSTFSTDASFETDWRDVETITQQMIRVRTADGKDAIRGTLAAEFAAGARQTACYIGFCPPFEVLPRVDANIADELEAEVKLTQILHNGAQLDVRLSEPAEEALAIIIEFQAVAR
ncbi:MAG TPA: hypothetical protein VFW73_03825 [Lacipirellulaceae bacterium]|nr:hypothetical protein [Lacipirellulaceae bacterium]